MSYSGVFDLRRFFVKNTFAIIVFITTLISFWYLDFFNVIPKYGIASPVGQYCGAIIFSGFCLRVFISGVSAPCDPVDPINADKLIFATTANLAIIAGFCLAVGTLTQWIVATPLMGYVLIKGIVFSRGNFLINGLWQWAPQYAWRKEIKTLLFITAITIAMEYIGLANGAKIPLTLLA